MSKRNVKKHKWEKFRMMVAKRNIADSLETSLEIRESHTLYDKI